MASKNKQTKHKWGVHAGRAWELVEGSDGGQTQADAAPDGRPAVWSHPVDVHYVCRGLSGWPRLHVQVWAQDEHGRNELSEFDCDWLIVCFVGSGQAAAAAAQKGTKTTRRRPNPQSNQMA